LPFIVNSVAPNDSGVSGQRVFPELPFNDGVLAVVSGLTDNQSADSVSLSAAKLAYVVSTAGCFDTAEFESFVAGRIGWGVVLLEREGLARL